MFGLAPRASAGLRGVPALRSELIKPQVHRTGEAPVRALSEAVSGGYKSEVVVLLQSIDPDILDIDIVQDERWEPQIIIQHKQTGPTPLSVFGDGVRRAAVIAALIPRTKGGILLIDELETALHVSVLKPVLGLLGRAVGELGVQVFATTHSLEAVDALLETLPHLQDEVVVFHLAVKDNVRQVKRFGGGQLERLRLERGLDIR
jgi:AAA15 family ATPase/GTPase